MRVFVCVSEREKLRGGWGGGEELITIFASHFTLSRHGVEESAKAQEEQQGEKEKNK